MNLWTTTWFLKCGANTRLAEVPPNSVSLIKPHKNKTITLICEVSGEIYMLLFNSSNPLITSIPKCSRWNGVTLYFLRREGERPKHLLPQIALTYLTFPDTERWAPALKLLRYIRHNTLTSGPPVATPTGAANRMSCLDGLMGIRGNQ